jgi:hypothetical protein
MRRAPYTIINLGAATAKACSPNSTTHWLAGRGPEAGAGVCRLRDYSALRASPFGSPSQSLRRSTGPAAQLSNPTCSMSGVRI